MTPEEFQSSYSGWLSDTLKTNQGQVFLSLLNSMRPPHESPKEEHLYADNRGSIRGYELCLRNIIGLMLPPKKREEIKPTYGVPDREKTDK